MSHLDAIYSSLNLFPESFSVSLEDLGCTPSLLKNILTRAKPSTGVVPDYIPALLSYEGLDDVGISVMDASGHLISSGVTQKVVTLQSLSKVFLYAYAIEQGVDPFAIADVEANGLGFSQDPILYGHATSAAHPLNNAGGISSASHIKDRESFLAFMSRILGVPRLWHVEQVYESEKKHRQHNLKIAASLVGAGIIRADVMYGALDTYTKACALGVSVEQVAHAACVLTRGGVLPDGTRLLQKDTVVYVLNAMNSYGLYNATGKMTLMSSGTGANTSKSGVSGLIMTIKTGRGAFVTLGHYLDSIGNSVFGVRAGLLLHDLLAQPEILRLTLGEKNELLSEYEAQVRTYTRKICLERLERDTVGPVGCLLSEDDKLAIFKDIERSSRTYHKLQEWLRG